MSACSVSLSGTKYALDKSIECFAEVMASMYMSCMLSLPPEGELPNICAACVPAASRFGK